MRACIPDFFPLAENRIGLTQNAILNMHQTLCGKRGIHKAYVLGLHNTDSVVIACI